MARISFAFLAAVALFLVANESAFAQTPQAGSRDVMIEWAPTDPEHEGAMWLAYLTARANFIDTHPALYADVKGLVVPRFDEEVEARSTAAQIYREMQQADATLDIAYFNDLLRIADASFMREYVWLALHQPTWTSTPEDCGYLSLRIGPRPL